MRRLLWLLFGLVLLVIVGTLIYGWLVGPAVSPAAGMAPQTVTARQALAPAAELAGQWREDARLAAVYARWPVAEMQEEGRVEWTFQFFSPSTQRLSLIAVAGGKARLVRESLSPYPLSTFSPEEWRMDSDRALQAWWNRGGEDLVARRPDADLAMQLRMPDEGGGQPLWTVVGSLSGTEATVIVAVNATTGVLVK
ncbi:MAG TPA: hypothetical protein VMY80_10075 [Anaerolineae bacterium]|nr:hypothetical protein [Anaerolineae bacterium]